ncbi:MAG: type II toxin-antitoxin system RelE/ParE family toxin [Holosporales bacterium]|jgi:mRNA interferase RelE/StbE|nr:type II toxin-antitoxin system RelE/ParE family toxin [Holosporales bacterium]
MWRIEFKESAVADLKKIPRNLQISIKKAICERIAVTSYRFKPLKGEWEGCYRLRVGDYRIIYEVNKSEVAVIIIKIGIRSDVY